MKQLLGVLLLAGAALALGADDKKDEPVKDELKKLEGTWMLVSSEHNGEKAPADAIKNAKAVVKGDKVTLSVDGKEIMEITMTVDPTKKPKTIDATATSGQDKGKKSVGIYELDGDNFKICYAEKERPKEFSAKKDSGCTLDTYKREKK
jgi:uncharacterized protein (TIGR03067 family)